MYLKYLLETPGNLLEFCFCGLLDTLSHHHMHRLHWFWPAIHHVSFSRARLCILGVWLICLPIRGSNPPKNPKGVVNRHTEGKLTKH